MSESDKSGKPEITAEDKKRIGDEALKVLNEPDMRWKYTAWTMGFNKGAEYATLHERSAAQARIAELEAALAIVKHDLKETQTKVIPGLIKFARAGQLEEYLIALELHLKSTP